MVECGGLENRCPFARTGGSNPSLDGPFIGCIIGEGLPYIHPDDDRASFE